MVKIHTRNPYKMRSLYYALCWVWEIKKLLMHISALEELAI